MKKLMPIVVVLIVVIAAAVWFFVLRETPEPPEVRIEHIPGDVFTVNVAADPEGNPPPPSSRILMIGIVLVINSEDVIEDLIEQNNRVRHTIIQVLRRQNAYELRVPDTSALAQELMDELNYELGINNIVEILFNEFVMA